MKVKVLDERKREIAEPYLIRFPGWTWERYLSEAPEMRFCEYENGDLIMPSPVDVRHQRVVGFLTFLLRWHCLRRRAGEVLTAPPS